MSCKYTGKVSIFIKYANTLHCPENSKAVVMQELQYRNKCTVITPSVDSPTWVSIDGIAGRYPSIVLILHQKKKC